jgi:signal transduction histidine kinase
VRRLLRGPTTVRGRTTLTATLVVALALLAGAALLVSGLEHSLTTAADQQARTRLTQLLDQGAAGTLPGVVDGIGDDSLAQVTDANGHVLASSLNIAGRPAIADIATVEERPRARTMRQLPDDQESEDYRIWSAQRSTPSGNVTAFVGPSLESSQEAIRRLVQSLAAGLPLLVAMLGLAIWVTVGRALRPIEQVRREVAGFGPGSLQRRIDVPLTHDEVGRLATTMNQMLDRLETADRRQREFVGNASHDLQSPLTVFRTELEVTLERGDLEEWRRTARLLLAETDQMEALVDDLLFLARAEEGIESGSVALDLEDLVAEEVSRFANHSGVEIRLTASGGPVWGQRQLLARMVRNLLLNAVEFADSLVEVRVGDVDGKVQLVVDDDGPGVLDEHRAEVFERFFTWDSSRDRRRRLGTGLGLAIARSVADAHAGSLTLEGPDPTSRFVVRLPRL